MSKGTQLSAVRIDSETRSLVEETIARRNFWTRSAPWTLSDFLRLAAMEKVAKMKRSRRVRKKRPRTRPKPKSQKEQQTNEDANVIPEPKPTDRP